MVNNDNHHTEDDPFDNPTGAMVTVFKSLMKAFFEESILPPSNPALTITRPRHPLARGFRGLAFSASSAQTPTRLNCN
jgi:hypothetical protein